MFNKIVGVMKSVFFTIVTSMLIGLPLAFAQQQSDTTGRVADERRQQYNQEQQDMDRQRDQGQQQDTQNRDAYANEGMVIVDQNELPESLRTKLQDEKYAGWENGTIYHNTNTGEYVIAPRAYRFDEQGNEIEPENTVGYDDASRSRDRNQESPSQYGNERNDAQQNRYDRDDMRSNDGQRSDTYRQGDPRNNDRDPSTEYRSGQQEQPGDDQEGQSSGENQYNRDQSSERSRSYNENRTHEDDGPSNEDESGQTQSSERSVNDQ